MAFVVIQRLMFNYFNLNIPPCPYSDLHDKYPTACAIPLSGVGNGASPPSDAIPVSDAKSISPDVEEISACKEVGYKNTYILTYILTITFPLPSHQ